jgi:formate dehydrogenase subunit delta
MDSNILIHMANRIGEFFEAMPDRPEALAGIAQHINRFWDPRMRHELRQHVDAQRGEGLRAIVLEALQADQAWRR